MTSSRLSVTLAGWLGLRGKALRGWSALRHIHVNQRRRRRRPVHRRRSINNGSGESSKAVI